MQAAAAAGGAEAGRGMKFAQPMLWHLNWPCIPAGAARRGSRKMLMTARPPRRDGYFGPSSPPEPSPHSSTLSYQLIQLRHAPTSPLLPTPFVPFNLLPLPLHACFVTAFPLACTVSSTSISVRTIARLQ